MKRRTNIYIRFLSSMMSVSLLVNTTLPTTLYATEISKNHLASQKKQTRKSVTDEEKTKQEETLDEIQDTSVNLDITNDKQEETVASPKEEMTTELLSSEEGIATEKVEKETAPVSPAKNKRTSDSVVWLPVENPVLESILKNNGIGVWGGECDLGDVQKLEKLELIDEDLGDDYHIYQYDEVESVTLTDDYKEALKILKEWADADYFTNLTSIQFQTGYADYDIDGYNNEGDTVILNKEQCLQTYIRKTLEHISAENLKKITFQYIPCSTQMLENIFNNNNQDKTLELEHLNLTGEVACNNVKKLQINNVTYGDTGTQLTLENILGLFPSLQSFSNVHGIYSGEPFALEVSTAGNQPILLPRLITSSQTGEFTKESNHATELTGERVYKEWIKNEYGTCFESNIITNIQVVDGKYQLEYSRFLANELCVQIKEGDAIVEYVLTRSSNSGDSGSEGSGSEGSGSGGTDSEGSDNVFKPSDQGDVPDEIWNDMTYYLQSSLKKELGEGVSFDNGIPREYLSELKSLTVGQNFYQYADLVLPELPNLEEVTIDISYLSYDDRNAGRTALKDYLANLQVPEENKKQIKKIVLKKYDKEEYNTEEFELYLQYMDKIVNQSSVEELSIQHERANAVQKRCQIPDLSRYTNIRTLSLQGVSISQWGKLLPASKTLARQGEASNQFSLQELVLKDCSLNGKKVQAPTNQLDIDKLQSLTKIDIHDSGIRSTEAFSNCSQLKELSLTKGLLSSLKGMEHLTSLTSVNFSQNRIQNIDNLSKLSNLTTLNLNENAIKDVTPISGLVNLQELYLREQAVGNKFLPIRSLRDISPLASCTGLTTLDISKNGIQDIQMLPSTIQNLNVDDNHIRDLSMFKTDVYKGIVPEPNKEKNPYIVEQFVQTKIKVQEPNTTDPNVYKGTITINGVKPLEPVAVDGDGAQWSVGNVQLQSMYLDRKVKYIHGAGGDCKGVDITYQELITQGSNAVNNFVDRTTIQDKTNNSWLHVFSATEDGLHSTVEIDGTCIYQDGIFTLPIQITKENFESPKMNKFKEDLTLCIVLERFQSANTNWGVYDEKCGLENIIYVIHMPQIDWTAVQSKVEIADLSQELKEEVRKQLRLSKETPITKEEVTRIKRIDWSGKGDIQGALKGIEEFKNLQFLDLSSCQLSDEDYKGIGQLTNIRVVSFDNNPVKASQINCISSLVEKGEYLTEVSLRNTGITNELSSITKLGGKMKALLEGAYEERIVPVLRFDLSENKELDLGSVGNMLANIDSANPIATRGKKPSSYLGFTIQDANVTPVKLSSLFTEWKKGTVTVSGTDAEEEKNRIKNVYYLKILDISDNSIGNFSWLEEHCDGANSRNPANETIAIEGLVCNNALLTEGALDVFMSDKLEDIRSAMYALCVNDNPELKRIDFSKDKLMPEGGNGFRNLRVFEARNCGLTDLKIGEDVFVAGNIICFDVSHNELTSLDSIEVLVRRKESASIGKEILGMATSDTIGGGLIYEIATHWEGEGGSTTKNEIFGLMALQKGFDFSHNSIGTHTFSNWILKQTVISDRGEDRYPINFSYNQIGKDNPVSTKEVSQYVDNPITVTEDGQIVLAMNHFKTFVEVDLSGNRIHQIITNDISGQEKHEDSHCQVFKMNDNEADITDLSGFISLDLYRAEFMQKDDVNYSVSADAFQKLMSSNSYYNEAVDRIPYRQQIGNTRTYKLYLDGNKKIVDTDGNLRFFGAYELGRGEGESYLNGLRVLSLNRCNIKKIDMNIPEGKTVDFYAFDTLYLNDNELTNDVFNDIATKTRVRRLYLNNNLLSGELNKDSFDQRIDGEFFIHTLELDNNQLTKLDLSALNLRQISAKNNQLETIIMPEEQKNRRIRKANFEGNKLKDIESYRSVVLSSYGYEFLLPGMEKFKEMSKYHTITDGKGMERQCREGEEVRIKLSDIELPNYGNQALSDFMQKKEQDWNTIDDNSERYLVDSKIYYDRGKGEVGDIGYKMRTSYDYQIADIMKRIHLSGESADEYDSYYDEKTKEIVLTPKPQTKSSIFKRNVQGGDQNINIEFTFEGEIEGKIQWDQPLSKVANELGLIRNVQSFAIGLGDDFMPHDYTIEQSVQEVTSSHMEYSALEQFASNWNYRAVISRLVEGYGIPSEHEKPEILASSIDQYYEQSGDLDYEIYEKFYEKFREQQKNVDRKKYPFPLLGKVGHSPYGVKKEYKEIKQDDVTVDIIQPEYLSYLAQPEDYRYTRGENTYTPMLMDMFSGLLPEYHVKSANDLFTEVLQEYTRPVVQPKATVTIPVKIKKVKDEDPTTEAPPTEGSTGGSSTEGGSSTTEAPTTEKPTTEKPTTERPTTEKPTTEKPTTEKPTTEKPTTEKPTTERPTTEKPTTEKPTTERPTTEKPTTEKPTTERPTTERPTTERPTTERPTTERPTTERPTTEKSTTEQGNWGQQLPFIPDKTTEKDNIVYKVQVTDNTVVIPRYTDPLKDIVIYDENNKPIKLTKDNILYNNVNPNIAGTYKIIYKDENGEPHTLYVKVEGISGQSPKTGDYVGKYVVAIFGASITMVVGAFLPRKGTRKKDNK